MGYVAHSQWKAFSQRFSDQLVVYSIKHETVSVDLWMQPACARPAELRGLME